MAAQLGTFAEEKDKAKAGRKKKRRDSSPSSEKKRKKKDEGSAGEDLTEKDAKRRKLGNDTHHSCHHHHHHHHHKHHHHHHAKEELLLRPPPPPLPSADPPVAPISQALFTLSQLERPRDKVKKKHRIKKENGEGDSPLRSVKTGENAGAYAKCARGCVRHSRHARCRGASAAPAHLVPAGLKMAIDGNRDPVSSLSVSVGLYEALL